MFKKKTNSTLTGWGHFLPERIVTNSEIVEKIEKESDLQINPTSLELITGVKTRRYSEQNWNSSDLATKSVENLLQNIKKDLSYLDDVDLLIFAAASQDLIEPATSAIIQHKLNMNCPTFDIKNACNSFLNALEISDTLIKEAKYKKILIVNGEKPSTSVKFGLKDKLDYKTHFAALSFGDGGASVLVERGDKDFLNGSKFVTVGKYWESGTLPGGGTMNPHDLESTYFRGSAKTMMNGFLDFAPYELETFLKLQKKRINDYDCVCIHQPTKEVYDIFVEKSGVKEEKVIKVFDVFGNIAAGSIPIGISMAIENGKIKKGDNILIIGLGGGITFGIMDIFI